jgi:hypothetical protein
VVLSFHSNVFRTCIAVASAECSYFILLSCFRFPSPKYLTLLEEKENTGPVVVLRMVVMDKLTC